MPVKKKLTDIAIRFQVLLERLKAGKTRDLASAFNQIDAATVKIIGALGKDVGQATKAELTTLLSELRSENKRLLEKATDNLWSDFETLAAQASVFERTSLQALSPKLAKLKGLTAEKAFQAAKAQPISATGQLLEPFVKDWTAGELERIENTIRKGWGEGMTNQKLVQLVRGTKANNYRDGIIETSRRNAQAVVRTGVQHVASSARMATWEANDDLIVGYRYVATLDSRTTQICRSLDGKVFKLGQGPVPPVHIGCRSTTIAEIDPDLGLDFLDEGATRASKDGPVAADLTYYDWLKTQDADFQKTALGASRAKLFQSGGLTAEKFAALNLGRNFEPLTLAEMQKLAPSAFAKAGVIPPKPINN